MAHLSESDFIPEPPAEVAPLIDGWLVLVDTGREPWACGMRLPRRRFWAATRILSHVRAQGGLLMRRLELYRLTHPAPCPLLGGG